MSESLQTSTIETQALMRVRSRLEPLLAAPEPFVVFVVAIDRLERFKDEATRNELPSALAAHLRERKELARAWFEAGDGVLWCAVPGVAAKDSSALARALIEGVRKAHPGGQRFTISAGIAASRHGVRAEVLIKVAEEGLAVAKNGGGDRAVHTDLYDLLQKKLTGQGLPVFKEVAPAQRAALRQVELPSATPTPALAALAAQTLPPALERAGDDLVEVLERRIAKLMSELAQAEERITQLEQSTSGGLASIYREVQGLAPTERLFEQKRSLMASIFEANLALRARAAS